MSIGLFRGLEAAYRDASRAPLRRAGFHGAIVVEHSSRTRKEELLIPKDDLNRVWVLRKVLTPLPPVEATQLLLSKMGKTTSNSEFLGSMANGGR